MPKRDVQEQDEVFTVNTSRFGQNDYQFIDSLYLGLLTYKTSKGGSSHK